MAILWTLSAVSMVSRIIQGPVHFEFQRLRPVSLDIHPISWPEPVGLGWGRGHQIHKALFT